MTTPGDAANVVQAHLRRLSANRQAAAAWRDTNATTTRQRYLDPLNAAAAAVATAVAQQGEPAQAALQLTHLVATQEQTSRDLLAAARTHDQQARTQFATGTGQLGQTQSAIADCEHRLQQALSLLSQAGSTCGRGVGIDDLGGALDRLVLNEKIHKAQVNLAKEIAIGLAPFLAKATSDVLSPADLQGIDNLVGEGIQLARDPAYRQRFVDGARQTLRFDQVGAVVNHIRRSLHA